MKIDSAKTNEANRRSETAKTDNSLRPSIYQTAKILETPPPTSSAFSKILEQARKDSAKDHEINPTREKEHTEENSKASKSDGDDSATEGVNRREDVEEKERHKGDSKGEGDGEGGEQSAFAAAGFVFGNRNIKENSFPAARSILHVADLERIVSAIRSQNLAGLRQLTLTLKNSVLEGLQIKISLDENGKYKAEFLAHSEQVKKQIEARKSELAQIFNERGLHFTGLDVRQNPDFSRENQSDPNAEKPSAIGELKTSENVEINADESFSNNDEKTFYRT